MSWSLFLIAPLFSKSVSVDCGGRELRCLAEQEAGSSLHATCAHKLPLALIGAGSFAKKAHLPSLRSTKDCFELRVVWSRSQASAASLITSMGIAGAGIKSLAGEEGWAEILRGDHNVSVVDVVLSIKAQQRFVKEALSAGLQVISEKPAGESLAGARDLLSLEQSIGAGSRRWAVAENWRFEPALRIAARAVALGAVGDVMVWSSASVMNFPADHPLLNQGSWRMKKEFDGGWISDVGVHMVAALRMVLGATPIVSGVAARRVRQELLPFDSFSAAFALPDGGAPGSWLFSLSSPSKVPLQLPGDGTQGLSHIELKVVGTTGSLVVTRTRVAVYSLDGTLLDETGPHVAYSVATALREAAHVFLGNGKLEGTAPEEAIEDLKVVESILDAAKLDPVLERRTEL